MSTKARYRNGIPEFYNGYETIDRTQELVFADDFLGSKFQKIVANENTVAPWSVVETSVAAITHVANTTNGVVGITVAATNETELGAIYWGDQLSLSILQGLVFEARVAFHTVPTTGTEKASIFVGLASAHHATPDTVATNCWFHATGSGLVNWETDDQTTDDDDNSTGITFAADEYHYLRIDCTGGKSDIKFLIDGVVVGTGDMSGLDAAKAKVQPYIRASKIKAVSNTGVASVYVDYVKVWQNRS